VGVVELEVVLLAVESPVIVALMEDEGEAPAEPSRRVMLVDIECPEENEDEVLAATMVVAKGAIDPLTLVLVEYET